MKSFLFLLFLLPIYCINISIIKTGLIYLPCEIQLLKFHHMVLLENENEKIVIDLIPEKINQYDIWKLLLGRDTPAKIRIRKIPENILDKNFYSFVCSPEGRAITNSQVNSLSLKTFLHKIKNWSNLQKNNNTMNIYKRNCQHYRHFIEQNYKMIN